MAPTVSYEIRYRLLKYVAEHPDATQRELASELGISLGKANYCLRALIEKGSGQGSELSKQWPQEGVRVHPHLQGHRREN